MIDESFCCLISYVAYLTLLLSMILHILVEDSALLEKLLLDNPDQTVKFKVYKRDCCPEISSVDRRLTRVKNKNRLPVGVWARWVVESISFIQSRVVFC